MKQLNLSSFGNPKYYHNLIFLVKDNPYLWHKVAHILCKLRSDLRPWIFVDRENQLREGKKYFLQSLKDSKLPRNVKIFLIIGVMGEFGFTFD